MADYRLLVELVFSLDLPACKRCYFESGDDLLDHLGQGLAPPDLILLDQHMPGRTGLETLLAIQEQADWQKVPVVVVSNGSTPLEVQDLHRAGAASYWTKPLELQPLRQLLTSIYHQWLSVPDSQG